MIFDLQHHADQGHTIEVTSSPMYCVTCDIFLTENTFEDTDAQIERQSR